MKEIFYHNKRFRQYDDCYYVSEDGEIYSCYTHKILKKAIDLDGYERVDIHSRHIKVHRLVYETWIGSIPKGMQINHKDDNKKNNAYTNLYAGTQKENIRDRKNNGHSVGHVYILCVYDKELGRTVTFVPAYKFADYAGHPCQNKNVGRCFDRDWFHKRFTLVSYKKIKDLSTLEGLTTNEG